MKSVALFFSRLLFVMLLLGVSVPSYSQSSGNRKKGGSAVKTQTPVKTQTKTKAQKSGRIETSADVRKQEVATQREIAATRKKIEQNELEVKRGLSELDKLKTDIDANNQLVASASRQVASLSNRISTLEVEISDSRSEVERMRTDYLRAVKKMRSRQNSVSTLAFIFSSSSFSQAMERMRYLRQISKWQERKTAELNRRVVELQNREHLLSSSKVEKDKALSVQISAQTQLKSQYARQDQVVAGLRRNGDALRDHLARKQSEATALKGKIAAIIAQEQAKAEAQRVAEEKRKAEAEEKRRLAEEKRKADEEKRLVAQREAEKKQQKNDKTAAKKEAESGATGGDRTLAANKPSEAAKPATGSESKGAGKAFGSMKGGLPRPVNGSFRVTSRFGRNSMPDLPEAVYDNPGIDAQVPLGATALAVYGGKVSGVYMISGYSTVVIVNHDGYYTVYGNLSAASVKVGDSVKQGQAIGRIAADDDNSSVSSLHFEVWRGREKLNPLEWIR